MRPSTRSPPRAGSERTTSHGRPTATRWVLDTNIYVRASHHREARRALDRFHDAHFGRTDLAATVWFELQIGVRTPARQADFDRWVATFTNREAVVLPSAKAFQQAGRVLGVLAESEGLQLDRVRPSLHHDVLLACTVREHGRTLITANAAHFTRIRRHLGGLRFITTLPV